MEKIILELEKSLFKYKFMSNITYLNEIIDDSYKEIGKSGRIFNKEDVIKELFMLNEDRNIIIYNFTCNNIDKNIYLVHYITKKGTENIFRTSIWKKDNNKFKIIFHQASLYLEEVKLIEY